MKDMGGLAPFIAQEHDDRPWVGVVDRLPPWAGLLVCRDRHRARVTHEPMIEAYCWWCCFDELGGDNWAAWDTLDNCLRDLSRHLHGPTP